jgi:serine phosphatase RsbU (regulator of sigma subunit)
VFVLTVRVPDQPARRVPVDKPSITLGRSSSSDIPLLDRTLSRVHARIDLRDGELCVSDLESRNGTMVNGAKITGLMALKPGDQIFLGETRIEISAASGAQVFLDAPEDGLVMERTLFRSSADLIESSKTTPRDTLAHEELVRVNRSLEILYEVSKRLLTNEPVSSVLRILMDSIFEYLQPDRGLLMLLDETGELRPEVVRFAAGIDPADIRLSKTLVNAVMEQKNGFLSIDTKSDARLGTAESIRIQGITSCMAAPLEINQKVLGLIYLEARLGHKTFTEFDLRLLAALANAAAIKIETVRLQEAEVARTRIEREVALAWDVQKRLLPESAPELPSTQLFGRTIPSRTVSGDYFDFFPDPLGRLHVVVADVCGKGIAASLLAASVQSAFQAWASEGFSPGELCSRLNEMVYRRSSPEKFITLFSALYDPATGEVVYSNAGHNPGVWLHKDGSSMLLESQGIPLGLFPGQDYPNAAITLAAGDLLLLYSDGLVEPIDSAENEFGLDRLIEGARNRRKDSLEEIADGIAKEMQSFVGNVPYADDRTMVILRRTM